MTHFWSDDSLLFYLEFFNIWDSVWLWNKTVATYATKSLQQQQQLLILITILQLLRYCSNHFADNSIIQKTFPCYYAQNTFSWSMKYVFPYFATKDNAKAHFIYLCIFFERHLVSQKIFVICIVQLFNNIST